jgi:N utilization substance protein A
VPDYQLSLAIGKEGQNARLAARLTGWKIDIQPDSPADPGAASADALAAATREQAAAGEPGAREPATGEQATGEQAGPEPGAAAPAGVPSDPADATAGEPGSREAVSGAGQKTGPGPGAPGTVRGGADAPAR